jgi:hypothetical protein
MYLRRKQQRGRREIRGEEHEDVTTEAWHIDVSPPENFPREATMTLTHAEAEYLQHRIAKATNGSLLATLVTTADPLPEEGMIWEHPGFTERRWPAALLEQVEHSQRFSEVMHGATLLYHHLLHAQRETEDGQLQESMEEWIAMMSAPQPPWDYRGRFWEIARQSNARLGIATPTTTSFVLQWIQLVQAQGAAAVFHSPEAQQLISEREKKLKGKLARLTNPEALKRWNGGSGVAQMDLRWGITRRLLKDIIGGLHAST